MSFRDEALKRLTGPRDGCQARLTITIEKSTGSYDQQTDLFLQMVEDGRMNLEELLKVRPELFDDSSHKADNTGVHFL